jgi:hypothetical protein
VAESPRLWQWLSRVPSAMRVVDAEAAWVPAFAGIRLIVGG